jgi:hypothetical protein
LLPITITQALDLPVAVVLIMFIPIGLWRGALREWIACAGCALGLLLGEAAGARWGEGFAHLLNMDPQLGGFTIGTVFFLASALVIGYGGGVALPYRPDLSWPNRALGALLGLGNGFLVIGGLLRLMQERLFDGRSNSPLHSAAFAAFLIDSSIAWVYLGFFLALLLCVGFGLARRINGGAPLLEEYSPVYQVTSQGDWTSAARWESQTPAVETWSEEGTMIDRNAPDQQTQVLRLVTAPVTATAEAPANRHTPLPISAKQPTPPVAKVDRPTPRPAKAAPAPRAGREHDTEQVPLIIEPSQKNDSPTLIPRPSAETNSAAVTRQRNVPPPESAAPTAHCPICSAPLAEQARFCGNCGHITGAAERRQIARQR